MISHKSLMFRNVRIFILLIVTLAVQAGISVLAQRPTTDIRQTTINAFATYRKDKVALEGNKQLRMSELLSARRDMLMLIDRKGIAVELNEYFDSLLDEWDKTIKIYEQLEKDSARLKDFLSQMPTSDDPLAALFGKVLITDPLARSAVNAFKGKWWPALSLIKSEHDIRQLKLLSQLSQKYNYQFLEAIYGKLPERDPYCGSVAITRKIDIPGNSNQIIMGGDVCRGDYLSIVANGQVIVGQYLGATGPDGMSDQGEIYNRVRGLPHGALLVNIGDGNWKVCGYDTSIFAENSGTIHFMINDKDISNNGGKYSVSITSEPANSFRKNSRPDGVPDNNIPPSPPIPPRPQRNLPEGTWKLISVDNVTADNKPDVITIFTPTHRTLFLMSFGKKQFHAAAVARLGVNNNRFTATVEYSSDLKSIGETSEHEYRIEGDKLHETTITNKGRMLMVWQRVK